MKLQLGETIRTLRARDGRTQEDLATAIGVSCQAVSRWEKGGSYPDMELIPAIAAYFGVSIDWLFGYDNERETLIDALVSEITEKNRANNGEDVCLDECIRMAREGLARYPGNEKLTLTLAAVLYNAGYARYGEHHLTDDQGYDILDTEKHKTYAEWAEAILLYEKLLENLPEGESRHQAVRELIQLYLNVGRSEDALALAETAPPLYDCRELLSICACDGKARAELTSKALLACAHQTAYLILSVLMSRKAHMTEEEAVTAVRGAISLYHILFPEGECGVYHGSLCSLHMYLSHRLWRAGQHDEAFAALDMALAHGKKFVEVGKEGDFVYTSPLVQGLSNEIDLYDRSRYLEQLPEDWPWWSTPNPGPAKAEMEKDPRWDDWVKRCREG